MERNKYRILKAFANQSDDHIVILVHDHEPNFYHYGTDHQECLTHVLRYLKDSIENEPDRSWNKIMHSLIQEMIHTRNGLQSSEKLDGEAVFNFEKRYLEVLETTKSEYENIPTSDYYRDGYNLFLGLEKYMQNHLLFLHDLRVSATNSQAERLLRNYITKTVAGRDIQEFRKYRCPLPMYEYACFDAPKRLYKYICQSIPDIWIKNPDGVERL